MKKIWKEQKEIVVPKGLETVYKQYAQNPKLTDSEKINMAGYALRELSAEEILYMAAVGVVLVDKTILYEQLLQKVAFPSVAKTAAKITQKKEAEKRTNTARNAANKRHKQEGGYAEKKIKTQELFATGRFKTKRACAKEAEKLLGIAYETAVGYLKNQPDSQAKPK